MTRAIRRRGLRTIAAGSVALLVGQACTPEAEVIEPEERAMLPAAIFGDACDQIFAEADEDPEDLVDAPMIEVLQALPAMAQFTSALRTSRLVEVIEAADEVTVIGPIDDAFEVGEGFEVDPESEADPRWDPDTPAGEPVPPEAELTAEALAVADVQRVLQGHVITTVAMDAQTLVDDSPVGTLAEAGGDITATAATVDTVAVESHGTSSRVVCANIRTADGMLHIVDRPLLPDGVHEDGAAIPDPDTLVPADPDPTEPAPGDLETDGDITEPFPRGTDPDRPPRPEAGIDDEDDGG